jgi:hypothetical protein
MPRVLAPASSLTLRGLARSGLVIAGLLLLGVGLGDSIAGRTKVGQYEELLRTTAPLPARVDPSALFPTLSENEERQELARTKLGFYHLLVTVGQILSAAGLVLIAAGILRLRIRGVDDFAAESAGLPRHLD